VLNHNCKDDAPKKPQDHLTPLESAVKWRKAFGQPVSYTTVIDEGSCGAGAGGSCRTTTMLFIFLVN
jgi:hypothetical protein